MSYRPHRRQIAGTRTVGIQTLLWLAAALAGALLCRPAAAATITFDFDGAGALESPLAQIVQFDFDPGNVLAVNGVKAITDYVASDGAINQPITLLYHAKMRGVTLSNGLTINLSNSYEITAVGRLTAKIESASTNSVSFTLTPHESDFFELWFDAPQDAMMLDGTGFNDGTLIASGRPIEMPLSAFVTIPLSPEPFDGYVNNDFPGITSVRGFGATDLVIDFRFTDPAFFPEHSQFGMLFMTDLRTPFQGVDPSARFSDTPGGVSPSGVTPSIGAINGVSGPDFQFEADARATIIPEPTSLVATMIGLTLVCGRRRQPRRRPIER